MEMLVAPASVAIVGALSSGLGTLILSYFRGKRRTEPPLEDRIHKLTEALRTSSHQISEIENEINQRKQLVEKLKTDADHYQTLITLNKDQVEAISLSIRDEMKREGQRSIWATTIISFIFFMMGAGSSWAISAWYAA